MQASALAGVMRPAMNLRYHTILVDRRPVAGMLKPHVAFEYIEDGLDQVIVELKVLGALSDVHIPQCRHYLRATGKPLCLLPDFGRPKVEIRRVTPSFACSVAQS
jgi:hypothetical protein